MSIFPTYGLMRASTASSSLLRPGSAGTRQAVTGGMRTWSHDGTVEAAFLIPNHALGSVWPTPLEIARAIVTEDMETGGVQVNRPIRSGVYAVVVKVGNHLIILPTKLQILAPGAYQLSRRGPKEGGPDYRWTLNGRPMDLQPAMAGHVPTWVWPDANLTGRFGGEAPPVSMSTKDWERRAEGRKQGRWPGPRTWRFDITVEDAFLIPNRVIDGVWPDHDELKAAELLHESRKDPYGAGRDVPTGVYTVVVFEGGLPRVLTDKIQVLSPGELVLSRGEDGWYTWTLNGKPMRRDAGFVGQMSTFVLDRTQ